MFGDLGRTPRSLLVCERSSLLDEKNRLSQQVEQQNFNYKVRTVVRVTASLKEHRPGLDNCSVEVLNCANINSLNPTVFFK